MKVFAIIFCGRHFPQVQHLGPFPGQQNLRGGLSDPQEMAFSKKTNPGMFDQKLLQIW